MPAGAEEEAKSAQCCGISYSDGILQAAAGIGLRIFQARHGSQVLCTKRCFQDLT
jgi:hypothetical protein